MAKDETGKLVIDDPKFPSETSDKKLIEILNSSLYSRTTRDYAMQELIVRDHYGIKK